MAYYGVSVKWGKPPVIGAYPEGKDYRAKTWQHSSPSSGAARCPPHPNRRSYSPYQFEVKGNANSDFPHHHLQHPLQRRHRLSPFGGPGAEQVNKIVAAELPFQQPSSLAGFAGFRLTLVGTRPTPKPPSPNASPTSQAFQAWASETPLPTQCSRPTRFSHTMKSWATPPGRLLGPRPDDQRRPLGLLVHLLPGRTAPQHRRLRQRGPQVRAQGSILHGHFLQQGRRHCQQAPLPDLRASPPKRSSTNWPKPTRGYKLSAKYLPIAGGFNVNSTSRRAWEAMLMGLKNRKLSTLPTAGPPC